MSAPFLDRGERYLIKATVDNGQDVVIDGTNDKEEADLCLKYLVENNPNPSHSNYIILDRGLS